MNIVAELIKNIKEYGLEYFHKYYSSYPAQVTSVDDPDGRGRIMIKCPTILGDKVLAHFAKPSDFRIAGKGHGEFFPPYVGDWVEVMFEYGDLRFPQYRGGYYANAELPPDFASGTVRGWVFQAGHKILIDEKNGAEAIKIIHKTGSLMQMNPDGSVQIQDSAGTESLIVKNGETNINSSAKVNVNAGSDCNVKAGGDVNVTAGGKANVKAGGDCIVKAGGNVNVNGSNINLNGSMGQVLTTVTDPVIDLITGAATTGVPNVSAGGG